MGGVADQYRPLFFYTNDDKKEYEEAFDIVHSKCYTEYGLTRTGCVGCPYSYDLENVLQATKEHEPKLYKACMNIFGKSYEYTRKYREFRDRMIAMEDGAEVQGQMDIFDFISAD